MIIPCEKIVEELSISKKAYMEWLLQEGYVHRNDYAALARRKHMILPESSFCKFWLEKPETDLLPDGCSTDWSLAATSFN